MSRSIFTEHQASGQNKRLGERHSHQTDINLFGSTHRYGVWNPEQTTCVVRVDLSEEQQGHAFVQHDFWYNREKVVHVGSRNKEPERRFLYLLKTALVAMRRHAYLQSTFGEDIDFVFLTQLLRRLAASWHMRLHFSKKRGACGR